MLQRTLQLQHSVALGTLLATLPVAGYLISQPETSVTIGGSALLGAFALLAVGVASACLGTSEAAANALKRQLADRDAVIARLNEVVREDERIVDVLSSLNQSIKDDLVCSAFHNPERVATSATLTANNSPLPAQSGSVPFEQRDAVAPQTP